MKKTFQVGQKVKITRKLTDAENAAWGDTWYSDMDASVGVEGEIKGFNIYGYKVEGCGPWNFPADVLELVAPVKPVKVCKHKLAQTIITTRGRVVHVTQKRDGLGRFVKGAEVSYDTLAAAAYCAIGGEQADTARVVIQHSYDRTVETGECHFQMVTVIRLDGAVKVASKTFLNSGYALSPFEKKQLNDKII